MSNDKVQSIMALVQAYASQFRAGVSFSERYETFKSIESAIREAIAAPQKRCPYCDDTGDVHSIDGEWRGQCSCPAGQAIAAPGVADGWQPIESAPKDGTEVILLEGARVGAAFWVSWSSSHTEEAGSGWSICWDGDDWHKPTHYMPLPAAPSPTTEQPIKGGPAE